MSTVILPFFNKTQKGEVQSLKVMKSRGILFIAVMCSVCLLTTVVAAHIPIIPDDGTTLATATEIIDPWKSWFYYSELSSGEAHYYKLDAQANERIRFMLNVPIPEGNRGFNPMFILMGPGIINQGTPPASVEIPSGVGVTVIEPSALEPEYEGFTPMSQYMTINLNMSAPETGTYYVAIFDGTTGGRYALVTGYAEAYTLVGWLVVPLDVLTLLQWSGQNLIIILLPTFIPLFLGLTFLFVKHRSVFTKNKLPSLLGTLGGFMFLGSSLSFFSQMGYALTQAPANWTVLASVIFATLPLILGIVVIRIVHRENWIQKRANILTLVIISLIAPFVWAGLYIGPTMVIIAGLLPLVMNTPT